MNAPVLAAISGILLFLSDYPARLWFLQLGAFIPWLYALLNHCPSVTSATLAGLCLGLCYTVPMMGMLRFPLPLTAILTAYMTAIWTLLSIGAYFFLRWPLPHGALAVACLGVLLEWLNVTLFPMWGTAQSFVRVWSAAPWAIQFVRISGMKGIVFVLLACQSLAAIVLTRPEDQPLVLMILAALLGPPMVYNAASWLRVPKQSIKAAALGWTFEHLDDGPETTSVDLFKQFFKPFVAQAANGGAKILVSPETGLAFSAHEREMWLSTFGDLARSYGIMLAIGYFNLERNDNRIAFIDSTGKLRGEYAKTHLIPFFENYRRGEGKLVLLDVEDAALGGMICQDDNFTDLARRYASEDVQIMAVPTNDWRKVKDYHFEACIFRAIEFGYAIVRGASNGISAIITEKGRVLARRDHFREGPGCVVADLPVGSGRTFYARFGEWLVVACAAALAGMLALRFAA